MSREIVNGPYMVDVSITNRCNLFCDFCYANSSANDQTGEIQISTLRKLFKEFVNMQVMRISITGGEPFLRKDLFEILELATSFDFGVVLNTNATLICEEDIERLLQINLERICVSIDSFIEAEHDKIRGNGAYKKALSKIELMQKVGLPVSILFTVTRNNIESMIDTILFFEKKGIEFLTVMVVCPTGRADTKSLISKDKWTKEYIKLCKLIRTDTMQMSVKIVPPNEGDILWTHYYPLEKTGNLNLLDTLSNSDFTRNKREVSCQAGIKAATVCSNGDVYGCDLMMGIPEFKAGNIHSNTFTEIWYKSNVFKKLRDLNFETIEGPCSKCDKEWCGAGCRSAAFNLTESIYGSDMSCYYAKEIYDE